MLGVVAGIAVLAGGIALMARSSREPTSEYPVIRFSTACADGVVARVAKTPPVKLGPLAAALRRDSEVISRRALPFSGRTTIPGRLQRSALWVGGTLDQPAMVVISHRGSPETVTRLLACGGYRPVRAVNRGTLYQAPHPVPKNEPAGPARWSVIYVQPGLIIGARARPQLDHALRALVR